MDYEASHTKNGSDTGMEVSSRMTTSPPECTYQITCNSCRETRQFDGFDEAQAFFNEHAISRHEVELRRIDSADAHLNAGTEDAR